MFKNKRVYKSSSHGIIYKYVCRLDNFQKKNIFLIQPN